MKNKPIELNGVMNSSKSDNLTITDVTKNEWEEIGKVWVDSGQILIADPCYVLSKDDYNKMDKTNHPLDLKHGIVNSGWGGDGNFPVLVKRNKRGLILEMKIVFNREDVK